MAQYAEGTNCPNCATLTAVAGDSDDELLVGTCGGCGATVSKLNPNYVAPESRCPECGQVDPAKVPEAPIAAGDVLATRPDVTATEPVVTPEPEVPVEDVTATEPVVADPSGDADEPGDDLG